VGHAAAKLRTKSAGFRENTGEEAKRRKRKKRRNKAAEEGKGNPPRVTTIRAGGNRQEKT